jgi:predicted Zn-dependent peptidase
MKSQGQRKEKENIYEYKNGFRIIYEKYENQNSSLTTICCFVKVGSVHESKGEEGMAHFIEHMCFKGTRKLHVKKEIMIMYDKIGAYFNAYTTKEYTYYIIRCNDEYVVDCIHQLSDMLMNSTFVKKEYVLEKQVVIEEMIRKDNEPLYNISKIEEEYLYSGSEFARPIDDLSFHNSKTSLDYNATKKMYNEFYRPNNMCISIVSKIPFLTIKRMISSSHFIGKMVMPSSNSIPIPIPSYKLNPQSKIEYDIRQKKGVNATHISISFRTCGYNNADKYGLLLLSHIIGGSMTSRMFSLLREQHGLTYTTQCFSNYYTHAGKISLYTMTEHTQMIDNNKNKKHGVLPLLMTLLKKLVKYGITQEELTNAKGFIKGQMTIQLENSSTKAEYNGLEYFIYETANYVPLDEMYETYYSKITKKQINDIIKKYIISDTMVVVLFGEHVPKMEDVTACCQTFSL